MAKRRQKIVAPMLPAPPLEAGDEAAISKAFTVAMLAAGQDGCTCKACRALRTVVDELFDQVVPEAE